MNKPFFILVAVMAAFSLNSCTKVYHCECPPGKTYIVETTSKKEAKKECESLSSGACTL